MVKDCLPRRYSTVVLFYFFFSFPFLFFIFIFSFFEEIRRNQFFLNSKDWNCVDFVHCSDLYCLDIILVIVILPFSVFFVVNKKARAVEAVEKWSPFPMVGLHQFCITLLQFYLFIYLFCCWPCSFSVNYSYAVWLHLIKSQLPFPRKKAGKLYLIWIQQFLLDNSISFYTSI